MKILVVEDELERQVWFSSHYKGHNLTFAKNADSAKKALDSTLTSTDFDVIFLDHDLGLGTNGYDVAVYMAANKLCCEAHVVIHSMNIVGAKRIEQALINTHKTTLLPFYGFIKKD